MLENILIPITIVIVISTLAALIVPTVISMQRFLFKVRTGFVTAFGAEGNLQYFLITKADYTTINKLITLLKKNVGTWDDDELRATTLERLQRWSLVINTQTKVTGWFTDQTGYWFTLNPFVTLIKSDVGKGEMFVQINTSVNVNVCDVEIIGTQTDREQNSSVTKVDLKTEIPSAVMVDFHRVFFVEKSTAEQITERVIAATRLLAYDRTYAQLLAQEYDPKTLRRTIADLIEFGLLPRDIISIYDVEISGRIGELLLIQTQVVIERSIADTEAETTVVRAKAEADALALKLEAENNAFLVRGRHEAEILERTVKAANNDANIVRMAMAENETGALPTGTLVYVGRGNTQKNQNTH